MAKPGVRDLSLEGDAVEDDPFLRPVELVGLGRREGQRNKCLGGLKSPFEKWLNAVCGRDSS
jgi:hypothetical protein